MSSACLCVEYSIYACIYCLGLLQISDKVMGLVSDPEKREEVMAELAKTLDPAEKEVSPLIR